MGTDLITIGNHRIDYTPFDFEKLGRLIADRLNQTQLANREFYKLSRLFWEDEPENLNAERVRELDAPWTHLDVAWARDEFYADNEAHGILEFEGPFEWQVRVTPRSTEISTLPFRYWQWMQSRNFRQSDQLFIDEYRKAVFQLLSSLGGDRVVYLADNSHPLEKFCYLFNFQEIESSLREEAGPPFTTFGQMHQWYRSGHNIHNENDTAYLIDDFANLDLNSSYELSEELQVFKRNVSHLF